jgi:hypothetical protein
MDRLCGFKTWEAFKSIVPNDTLCADTELVRVGFLSPAEVRDFIEELRMYGICFSETGPAEDAAVCDQLQGFTTECDWAEFGSFDVDENPDQPAAAARLTGSKISTVATPIGWSWEQSLTRNFFFAPSMQEPPSIRPTTIRGISTGMMEGGAHGWGVHVQGLEPEGLKPRSSLWDRFRGRR